LSDEVKIAVRIMDLEEIALKNVTIQLNGRLKPENAETFVLVVDRNNYLNTPGIRGFILGKIYSF